MSAAQNHTDGKPPTSRHCVENLEQTRRLVGELRELADAARSTCDQDGCLLLYGVVEDCCLRIGSLLDWRSQRLQTQSETEAVATAPASQEYPSVIPTPEYKKE